MIQTMLGWLQAHATWVAAAGMGIMAGAAALQGDNATAVKDAMLALGLLGIHLNFANPVPPEPPAPGAPPQIFTMPR